MMSKQKKKVDIIEESKEAIIPMEDKNYYITIKEAIKDLNEELSFNEKHAEGIRNWKEELISLKTDLENEKVQSGGANTQPLKRGSENEFRKYKRETQVVAHIYSHELNKFIMEGEYERTRDDYVDKRLNFRRTSVAENTLHSIIDHRLMNAYKEFKILRKLPKYFREVLNLSINIDPPKGRRLEPQDLTKRIFEQLKILDQMQAFKEEKIFNFYKDIIGMVIEGNKIKLTKEENSVAKKIFRRSRSPSSKKPKPNDPSTKPSKRASSFDSLSSESNP